MKGELPFTPYELLFVKGKTSFMLQAALLVKGNGGKEPPLEVPLTNPLFSSSNALSNERTLLSPETRYAVKEPRSP